MLQKLKYFVGSKLIPNRLFLIDKGLTNDEKLVLTLPEYPQQGMAVKLAASKSSEALK